MPLWLWGIGIVPLVGLAARSQNETQKVAYCKSELRKMSNQLKDLKSQLRVTREEESSVAGTEEASGAEAAADLCDLDEADVAIIGMDAEQPRAFKGPRGGVRANATMR